MRHPVAALVALLTCWSMGPSPAAEQPNFVILYCDDLGYGDLGCYGHPTIRTPHLDRMAAEGQRWTNFYSAASVCTPSRAAIMTGRLPPRNGMCHDVRRVLFPNSLGGLPPGEITLAKALKNAGYATACVGKWHLGHLPQYLPTSHGFDSYLGLPYSNDMDRVPTAPAGQQAVRQPRIEWFNVPLMQDARELQRPADQPNLTQRYTDEAVRLIRAHRQRPFFLYLAYTFPHVPLFASEPFKGKSPRGIYGDTVEEIDASVGRVLQTLRELGLERKTLVVFSSDNGPWLIYDDQGGSAGLLREGKGSTWEGGMREPAIFWWPGTIRPAVVQDIGCTMDLFPTFIKLAGGQTPTDRVIDGLDIAPALLGKGPSPRQTMFFYRDTRLFAVRHGPFKAHFYTQSSYGRDPPEKHDPPLLYHLGHDPSEKIDVAARHPAVLAEIRRIVAEHEQGMQKAPSQLEQTTQKEKAAKKK